MSGPRDPRLIPILSRLLVPAEIERLREAGFPSYWEAAVEAGLSDDDTLLAAASRELRLPVADLAAVSPQALELVDEGWARRHRVLPLAASPREIQVATADPFDVEAERAVGFASGRRVAWRWRICVEAAEPH